jgi:hypothetical protein
MYMSSTTHSSESVAYMFAQSETACSQLGQVDVRPDAFRAEKISRVVLASAVAPRPRRYGTGAVADDIDGGRSAWIAGLLSTWANHPCATGWARKAICFHQGKIRHTGRSVTGTCRKHARVPNLPNALETPRDSSYQHPHPRYLVDPNRSYSIVPRFFCCRY